MRILGVFYTNNNINKKLLHASMESVKLAISNFNLCSSEESKVVFSSYEKLEGVENEVSYYKHNGHLNIITQILRAIYNNTNDYTHVAFLEHDCLYHPEYFKIVRKQMEGQPPIIEGCSNLNYVGLNETGYLKVVQQDQPMSQIVLKKDFAIKLLNDRLKDCIIGGQCVIEPSRVYLTQIKDELRDPQNIHVNMNHTKHNHHLTNHYNTYENTSSLNNTLSYWGNCKTFEFFD